MKIEGANLGTIEAEYKLLSEGEYYTDKRQEILKRLESMYLDIVEQSKRIQVQSLPQEEGKVKLLPGMLNHKCTNSIESLRTISEYGILASEWFGELESEGEAAFCAFLSRVHEENDSKKTPMNNRMAQTENMRRLNVGSDLVLFFDSNNPIMQKLLHLDFFEYERIKQEESDKIKSIYTDEEVQLFDELIEPESPAGRDFHLKNRIPVCDWSAIPGGIPSALVNGICTKGIEYEAEYIQELAQLFPNATIFNNNLEIIYMPKKEKSTQALGMETVDEQMDINLMEEIAQMQVVQEVELNNGEHQL